MAKSKSSDQNQFGHLGFQGSLSVTADMLSRDLNHDLGANYFLANPLFKHLQWLRNVEGLRCPSRATQAEKKASVARQRLHFEPAIFALVQQHGQHFRAIHSYVR